MRQVMFSDLLLGRCLRSSNCPLAFVLLLDLNVITTISTVCDCFISNAAIGINRIRCSTFFAIILYALVVQARIIINVG